MPDPNIEKLSKAMALSMAYTKAVLADAEDKIAAGDVTGALKQLSHAAACIPNLSAGLTRHAKDLELA